MTNIDKAKKKAAAVLEAARKEYAELQEEIDSFTCRRDAAAAEMDKAGDNADLIAYQGAKESFDEAETALTMYTDRAAKLEGEALLSEKEYAELCSGIISETNKYFEDLREELYNISEKLEKLHDEAADKINSANRVLHTLQYDCYRGQDLIYRGNLKSPDPSSILKVGSRTQWDLVQWADRMRESANYQTMKKERSA